MNEDEFEIRLTDVKAKFIKVQETEMAFAQASGEYNEAITSLLKFAGVNPDKRGNVIIPDLIDKIRRPKSLIIAP
jgi:hypothetical protein